ncbi:MAG: IS3 family transposase [Nitrospira sp.]|nr:IS3 family transposase [Nitrospira sp.]
MSRCTAVAVAKGNESVVQRIHHLKAEHPFWGYRRIWAQLRFVDGLPINKKHLLRLMRAHHVRVSPNPRLKAQQTPIRSQPRPTVPN